MIENLINAFNEEASGVIGLNVQMYQSEPDKILIQFKQVLVEGTLENRRDYFVTLNEEDDIIKWVEDVIKYGAKKTSRKTQDLLAVAFLNCYLRQCGITKFHAELDKVGTKPGIVTSLIYTDCKNIVDSATLSEYRYHYGVTKRADSASHYYMSIERQAIDALEWLHWISWDHLVQHLEALHNVPKAPNIWEHLVDAIGVKLKHVDKFTL